MALAFRPVIGAGLTGGGGAGALTWNAATSNEPSSCFTTETGTVLPSGKARESERGVSAILCFLLGRGEEKGRPLFGGPSRCYNFTGLFVIRARVSPQVSNRRPRRVPPLVGRGHPSRKRAGSGCAWGRSRRNQRRGRQRAGRADRTAQQLALRILSATR